MKDLSCLSPARLAAVATFAGLLCVGTPALAAQVVTLASAQGFAVVGNAAVTATAGTSTITGDVGVMLSTLTGTPVVNGTIYENGVPEATAAHADFSTAFFAAAGATCPSPNNLTGFDLGVLPTLVPGVYCFSSSAGLTGTLVLDGQNVPDGEFIFQIASSFTTASNSSVIVINPGANLQVIWQVGSSATLGTGTNFIGNILADASVTLNTDASVSGRAFARTAAVTMDKNTVSCGT